ncbi:MAG: Fe-S cluster assembly protein SufD [Parvularculaceae bacterium]
MRELTEFEERLAAGAGAPAGGDALDALRAAARARLAEGLPNRRVEAWKYTDLRSLLREGYAPAPAVSGITVTDAFAAAGGAGVSIVNGAPQSPDTGKRPEGVRILSFSDALAKEPDLCREFFATPQPEGAIFDMNAALAGDGLVIMVADGVTLDAPIRLAFGAAEADGGAFHGRILVKLGAGARARILESHTGPDDSRYLANLASNIVLGEGASLERILLQGEGNAGAHLAGDVIDIGPGGRYYAYLLSTGAAVSRREIHLRFAGAGAQAHLAGASLLRGRQHGDVTLLIDHAHADCISTERFRSVLDESARGVFQGKVLVRREGQGTDAQMRAQALLLAEGAEADAKPELEIYADEVACAHGATAGALDADALFYMRARGLDEKTARALLIEAFVRETASGIDDDSIRAVIEARVAEWLGAEVMA